MAPLQIEREVYTEVLKLFRSQPNLWDVNHKLYHDRNARNRGFDLLADKMKVLGSDITVELVKRKIENMRSTYGREWRKVQKGKQQGVEYKPTLWYYDLLTFLNDDQSSHNAEQYYAQNVDSSTSHSEEVIQPRPMGSFVFISADGRNADKYEEDHFMEESSQERDVEEEYETKFDILNVEIKESSQPLANLTTFVDTNTPIPPKLNIAIDEDYHFLMSLLPQLRKFEGLQKIRVKIEFMNSIAREVERVT